MKFGETFQELVGELTVACRNERGGWDALCLECIDGDGGALMINEGMSVSTRRRAQSMCAAHVREEHQGHALPVSVTVEDGLIVCPCCGLHLAVPASNVAARAQLFVIAGGLS